MLPLPPSRNLQAFSHLVQKSPHLLLEGLNNANKAFVLSFLQKILQKPIVIITGKENDWMINGSFFCEKAPLELPSWDILPGEKISPSFDIMGNRLETLKALASNGPEIVVTSWLGLIQKILPKNRYHDISREWKKGQSISFDEIPSLLENLGYTRTSVVSDKAEYAVRGGLIDLFPIDAKAPFRVEFFGDEIEEIRTFDPAGQKSITKVGVCSLGAASEKTLLEEAEERITLLDLFGIEPLIVFDEILTIEDQIISSKRMEGMQSSFFTTFDQLSEKIKEFPKLFFCNQPINTLFPFQVKEKNKEYQTISFEWLEKQFHLHQFFHTFSSVDRFFDSDDPIIDVIANTPHKMDLTFVSKAKHHKTLKEKLQHNSISSYSLKEGEITEGFVLCDLPYLVVSDKELFGAKALRRQKMREHVQTPLAEFHHLTPGDYVVHFHSGLGRYLGTEKQTDHKGNVNEFITIEYAQKSKLYVPLSQAHLVSRYIGTHETKTISLSNLGSKQWQKIRHKAQNAIVGYAAELLELYATREVKKREPFPPDSEAMQLFEEEFPFEETVDQIKAIEDIKKDMLSDKPMDRLICGDVGYGKTEVAMRAAFKCVYDGKKQVVVLVPTTVLALQHYDTFSMRMGSFPVEIGILSRAHTALENRKTIQKLKEGKIDIIIGTHRLLSKDLSFPSLGLIIIDEEQRFGVKAKEKLKSLKKQLDYLTMSATPIPRTLYLSLMQLRNISTINTPPQDRLPVKTIIAENSDEVVKNALLRELARGGQAFFLHNRVESIAQRASYVQKLVPQASVAIVHGQMDAEAIDLIFHRFKQGEVDILFSTTLIENGVDVPNANTILVDHANHFGLADLYQLRGRVGRWNRPAYAYFLVPKRTSPIAKKRLSALLEASSQGGGMKIALRDLELRGAGDILGIRQSGQVSTVGFHLYCKMLKRAIDALKQKISAHFTETKMDFYFDAKFPESYIEEANLRMELYHRLGESTTFEDVDQLQSEIKDRFGAPPEPVIWLYYLTRMRIFASANEFTSLKFTPQAIIAEHKKKIKTIPYPFSFKDPKKLEEFLFSSLEKEFSLKKK